jgi:hypothetical protein
MAALRSLISCDRFLRRDGRVLVPQSARDRCIVALVRTTTGFCGLEIDEITAPA